MLYDRVLMEFLAEGLAVAGVLDAAMGMRKSADIEVLIGVLQNTVRIHEVFCRRFPLEADSDGLLASYDRSLLDLAAQLEVVKDKACIS